MTHSYSGLQTWRQIIYRLQILFLLFCFSIAAAQTTVIFHEDFEGDWTTNWHADAGTWEAGEPVSGPSSAYEGTNCAATVLDGNYTTSVSSRFIMHTSIIIPEALEYPRLRFQQWYSFAYHDYGKVQIKVDGTSDWFDISCQYNNTGGEVWTYPSIDLSDYAGQSVQIAFYFYSETVNNSTGWYVDDIEVVTGVGEFYGSESWENGIGDWASERGTWEVGVPTIGPQGVYSGEKCAATILGGNYTTSVSSRLISPKLKVAEALEYPRLRFQQWYSFAYHDYGKVQIKVDGTSDWLDISCEYNNTGGGVWTYPSIDLSDYAGQSVQIAFYFYSETVNNSTGWYIDDVEVVTGMQKFNNPESWERGIGDWASERGAWEIGVPTSGPGSAYEGVNCAATVLSGNYTTSISSRLISPVFNVPATSENPVLRFQHWYSFAYHDYGKVQVKVEGTSEWNDIADGYFNNTGGSVWTYTYFPISEYSNQSVQIGFLMYSETVNNSTGWYIDDIFIQGLTTDLDKKVDEQNSGFLKNAPNPFSSTTQISYVIINTEHVYLRVYNELGQIVATLVNRVQEPGKHSVDFDSSGLPSGIYFYQLQCGNTFSDTKKMIKAVK